MVDFGPTILPFFIELFQLGNDQGQQLKILVTNDDGIQSKGILVLAKALGALGEVSIVAPDREKSAVAHSLTLHRPLRVERIKKNVFAVDGTPADCVHLAVNAILPGKPDLLVSGINKGENVGNDITYSGTVSAAFEGTLHGIPEARDAPRRPARRARRCGVVSRFLRP